MPLQPFKRSTRRWWKAATHNRRSLILRMLIGLALAVAGLAWALRDVGFDQVVQVFGSIRPLPAFTAFACSAMVAVFKAARWRWLYYPHHRRLIYRHIFSTLVIAQMINNISPVRIGEIVRILLIHRRAGVGKAATLSTIVAEKVMDLLCLSGLVLAALAATREWAAMRLGLALVAGGALAKNIHRYAWSLSFDSARRSDSAIRVGGRGRRGIGCHRRLRLRSQRGRLARRSGGTGSPG